ncbi:MAG: dihydropteroate synthase [Acidobacteria bacterium]|nr:dihydropteroate synthase [Acidobacteriota bacterium]
MQARRKFALSLPRGVLVLGERTLVMGILNVTPDSFSDGGRFLDPGRAAAHALAMQRAGADLIDIGGESTRPGSTSISAQEELERILPVLQRLRRKLRIPISVDTSKAEVAEAAIAAGAQMINDISGLRFDVRLAKVAKRGEVPLVLAHIRGTPKTMHKLPPARNILREVERGLAWSVRTARAAGVRHNQLLLDPGIGFGKTVTENYQLLYQLERLERFRLPLLIGTSRKSFIGKVLDNAPPDERLWGTAATVAAAILQGVHMVRVHDVAEMLQVARVADAILRAAHQ